MLLTASACSSLVHSRPQETVLNAIEQPGHMQPVGIRLHLEDVTAMETPDALVFHEPVGVGQCIDRPAIRCANQRGEKASSIREN